MIVLDRTQWGADPDLPRRGHEVGPARRTGVYVHHTAIVDADATPNLLETRAEALNWMRRLQRIRPDLGLDVPYNMVGFCMSDGELILCEGRGVGRTAAHARNHNRSALGIALHGDFQTHVLPASLGGHLRQLGDWLRSLRNESGFVNLGHSRPPGRQVWGHRDAPGAATLCPGDNLYRVLAQIRFIDEEDETAMDKPSWKLVQRALQAQSPPLYAGRLIDGLPGRNTNTAVQAFERRMGLDARGVVGDFNDPGASIWPATRELLFASAAATLVV